MLLNNNPFVTFVMSNFHLPHHTVFNVCLLTDFHISSLICRSYTGAASQLFIYSTKWSAHYIIANYLAGIEFVGMFFLSQSSWQKIPHFISIRNVFEIQIDAVGGRKIPFGHANSV